MAVGRGRSHTPSPRRRSGCRWEPVHGTAARIFACWRVAKVADGATAALLEAGGARCGGVGSGWPRGWRWVEAAATTRPQGGGRGAGGSRWMAWARELLRVARGQGCRWPRRRCQRRGGAMSRRGERLAARVAAGRGCSHTPSPRRGSGCR
eukprot:scaffold5266_cov116-Isochrysis_galbana.AAC.2